MVLHHLGIATMDIRETLRQVGEMLPIISHTDIIHDPEQGADLCMVSVKDSVPVELISGMPVSKMAKKGIMLYHMCWETDNMEATIAHLSATASCLVISPPKPAVLFGGRNVAFLSGPIGLMELLSRD